MNTKSLKVFAVAAAILLSVSACGLLPARASGNLVTETREVSGFDAVEFSGAGEVEIIQDGTESITITTDDDVMPYVTTEVVGGTLHVDLEFPRPSYLMPTEMRISLHVASLTGLTISGAWRAHAETLETDSLAIVTSGAGTVLIDTLTAADLEVEVSGAGKMEIAGQAGSQSIALSGAGKYLAGDLQSETVQIDISGAGEATLWATESLEVTVSGSGNVEYYGRPQVSFDESGAGSIRSLGDK